MSEHQEDTQAGKGAMAAIAAYFIWGLFPIYWKQLANIDAVELIAHRTVWSWLVVMAITVATGGLAAFWVTLRTPKLAGLHALSALFVSVNWLTYVWGVNHAYILEASLGYYLVPLVNVALGRFLLHEHLRRGQWVAIGLASVGVALQLAASSRLPWVALVIAASWAGYGLLRKRSPLGSLAGLCLETALATPVALAFLLERAAAGTGAFGRVPAWQDALLAGAGVVTAVPLLLFAYGVRRLRLSTVGFLQYLVPSMTFLIGVFVYHEPLDRGHLLSFAFIWAALAIYSVDNLRANASKR